MLSIIFELISLPSYSCIEPAILKNNLLLFNCKYSLGNIFNKDPLRDRKLLLNKREIFKLVGLIKQKGYSLVPISLYFSGNFVKVELGIGKGKKLYDKREDIAKKDAELRIRKQYGKIL